MTLNSSGELEEIYSPEGTRKQKRDSDNFFLKYSADLSPHSSLDLSINYAKYNSYLFASSVLNSGYDSTHDGLGFTGVFKHDYDIGKLELTASTQTLEDDRKNDQQDYVELLDYSDWKNPQSLRSGGQGDLTTKQNIHTAKAVMRFNPIEDGFGITHQPTLGSEVSYT
ncbi:hypothetical protein P3471_24215, partial [Vibrio parahaemolyticus]|nr:hypothetical protein [Vibrio parahaemolyticus]